MNSPIRETSHAGKTIRYGNIQFGGNDGPLFQGESGSNVRCTPPHFSLRIEPKYDAADREVVAHQAVLSLGCWIYSESMTLQSDQLRRLQEELLIPRQLLDLGGIGVGLEDAVVDVDWGPKPIECSIRPIGQQTAELKFAVQFQMAPCSLDAVNYVGKIREFVLRQSQVIDEQGKSIQTTAGHLEVSPLASGTTQAADSLRDSLIVHVPTGFRRTRQRYQQSPDQTRLEFEIVDTELRGDILPTSIIDGDGSFSMRSISPGLNRSELRLAAELTVAPGVSPSVAAQRFFQMASQKQADFDTASAGQALMLPTSLSVQRGLWEQSRSTRFDMRWMVATCVGNFLNSGFWAPLPDSNYTLWSQSVAASWNARGAAQLELASLPPTNLCDQIGQVVISTPSSSTPPPAGSTTFGLGSSTIDPQFSWIDYDISLKFSKNEQKTFHRQAVSPQRSSQTISDDLYGTAGMQPEESFVAGSSADIVEENGLPQQYILLKAKGLRAGHLPVFPTLVGFSGLGVELMKEELEIGPAFSTGVPIYQMRGFRLYKVSEPVTSLSAAPTSPVVC